MNQPSDEITRIIPAATLQRILDTFAAATGYAAVVRSTDGRSIVQSGSDSAVRQRGEALNKALARSWGPEPPQMAITVGSRRMATLALRGPIATAALDSAEGAASSASAAGVAQAEAAQLLYLLADTLAQACKQGVSLHHRVEELGTLLQLSRLLTAKRKLSEVLQTVARSVAEALNVKAAAIRLLDESGDELQITAAHNLSPEYLTKGTIALDRSLMDQMCLAGDLVYVANMHTSDLVMFPEDAKREGLASVLAAGMIYRGKPIGVLRVFTEERHRFTEAQKGLLRAIAQMAAGSIRNAQLDDERRESSRIRRQVELAADVQRRLLPQGAPRAAPFDIAGRYEPCFELGGDFYDYITLEDSLGIVIGDVVGKGVAASLLMASVRASLRAHAQDVYDLDDVMMRVNQAMVRDTRDNEFATVFYCTLDRNTMRMTYCSAGHEPTLLYRDDEFTELKAGGMVLGVDGGQTYDKGMVELREGDILLFYTDGVTDGSSFSREKFGVGRIKSAVQEAAAGSAQDIVNHVLWQVRRFVGLNHRPDDMTLVAVKVEGGRLMRG